MEALQILKFTLKQEQLNFIDSWGTAEPDMRDNDTDDSPDLLDGLLSGAEGATGMIMAAISLDDED